MCGLKDVSPLIQEASAVLRAVGGASLFHMTVAAHVPVEAFPLGQSRAGQSRLSSEAIHGDGVLMGPFL